MNYTLGGGEVNVFGEFFWGDYFEIVVKADCNLKISLFIVCLR